MEIFSIILQIIFLLFGSYYFGISLFAWVKRKEAPVVSDKDHTFALVVAAAFFICSTISANAIAYTLKRLDDEILLE